jgi:hypothetical protein
MPIIYGLSHGQNISCLPLPTILRGGEDLGGSGWVGIKNPDSKVLIIRFEASSL